MKKTTFKMPAKAPVPAEADSWVKAPTADVSEAPRPAPTPAPAKEAEVMKRFTIDVSESLHKRIKTRCASDGTKMADVIRDLLEREFPAVYS